MTRIVTLAGLFCFCLVNVAAARHRLITQGNGKLAIVNANGSVQWEMPWGGIHDIHVLPNGHIMTLQHDRRVVEIDPKTKQVVWSYDASRNNGNVGRRVEVHSIEPLPGGNVMISESGAGRILEITRAGKIVREIKLRRDRPNAHSDTRLVRKLKSGNYLVCQESDGFVREYDASGKVVWEYDVPLFGRPPQAGHGPDAWGDKCFAALRLASGNTLITTGNGHGVLEVTPEKKIIWRLQQHDLPGIRLAWVTTLEVLPNGNYMIGNCHAGPGQPLLVELEPKTKRVVWTFNQFERFGNSVSNSQLLESEAAVAR